MYIRIRTAVVAALLGVVVLLAPASASAETLDSNEKTDSSFAQLIDLTSKNDLFSTPVVAKVESKPAPKVEQAKPEPPKPIEYVVVEGDSLDKIAEGKATTWLRLWQKNTNISNPDLIYTGDTLIIPTPDEQLADRPLPVAVPAPIRANTPLSTQNGSYGAVRGSSAGNTYTAGQCTWYVKNRRPDLPNNLGNADTWFYRAQAQGLPVGYSPRTGAAAQAKSGMHVVYVEGVNGDGTITISEMNYNYVPYSTRTTTVSADNYLYIY